MARLLAPLLLVATLAGCAIMEPILDYPMSFFTDDGDEVETTLGDVVADTLESDEAGGIIGTLMGANPLLAAAAGAAAAAAAAAARRKKKEASSPSKGKKS